MADFETQGQPVPFNQGVSHAPLNLGGGDESETPAAEVEERPAAREAVKKVSWPDRITGCKTFYAKLHAGAIDFLEDQIAAWLRDNPGVSIKRSNMVVGEIQAKKTEPNLIIVVWY